MIFMSLNFQIEGIQIFYTHQKQRNEEENMKRRKNTFVIFWLNVFEEKTLTIFIFKPHIFLNFSPF
jgi:hypothetical protein